MTLVLPTSEVAYAQIDVANQGTISTNIPGVRLFKPAPENLFLQATNASLAEYGIPVEPDRSDISAHSRWNEEMLVIRARILPDLAQTNIRHRPAQHVAISPSLAATVESGTSTNWSGYVISGDAKPFAFQNVSNAFISARFAVPKALCDEKVAAGPYYSSAWVGFDGYPSDDVLQVGTESDVNCPGRNAPGQASNYAWFEWAPNYAVRVSLVINPGDVVSVSLVAYGSPTVGKFSIMNWTTGQSSQGTIASPAGVQFVGDSAEWIVEAPDVNDHPSNLANYASLAMKSAGGSITPRGSSVAIPIAPTLAPSIGSARIYNFTLTTANNSNASVVRDVNMFPTLPKYIPDGLMFVDYESQMR